MAAVTDALADDYAALHGKGAHATGRYRELAREIQAITTFSQLRTRFTTVRPETDADASDTGYQRLEAELLLGRAARLRDRDLLSSSMDAPNADAATVVTTASVAGSAADEGAATPALSESQPVQMMVPIDLNAVLEYIAQLEQPEALVQAHDALVQRARSLSTHRPPDAKQPGLRVHAHGGGGGRGCGRDTNRVDAAPQTLYSPGRKPHSRARRRRWTTPAQVMRRCGPRTAALAAHPRPLDRRLRPRPHLPSSTSPWLCRCPSECHAQTTRTTSVAEAAAVER